MVSISEILIKEDYGRLYLQKVVVTDNTAIAFVCVPKDIKIYNDSSIKKHLLSMKNDLNKRDLPKEITFIMLQGNRTFASGVDNCQRFCCEIKDPAQYMLKMFCSKKSDWLSKMIEATDSEGKIKDYKVENRVVSPEEAVLTLQRLGVI